MNTLEAMRSGAGPSPGAIYRRVMDPKEVKKADMDLAFLKLTFPKPEDESYETGYIHGKQAMLRECVETLAKEIQEAEMNETLSATKGQKEKWRLAVRICKANHAKVSMLGDK